MPDARELFYELEAEFERDHEVNLVLVESFVDENGDEQPLSWYYYDGGLLATDADVYEIDTVLLADMIRANKIITVELPAHSFREDAVAAVTVNGETWSVPHWVCGNFLFFRAGDSDIQDASTWSELMAALEPDGSFLIDLKGRSTLGEWYLTGLAATRVSPDEILAALADPELDDETVNRLGVALSACPEGYCRNNALHDRTGFYSRVFARGRARAYMGYSESIHYGLSEIVDSCGPDDGCLSPDQIAVRTIPGDGPEYPQIGWVDGFGIANGLGSSTEKLARDFVEFATSWAAHKLVLEPEWPDIPRYLLPAVTPAAGDVPLSPPLYREFFAAYGSRLTLTQLGLNDRLRQRGTQLDCRLPPVRRELVDWLQRCR